MVNAELLIAPGQCVDVTPEAAVDLLGEDYLSSQDVSRGFVILSVNLFAGTVKLQGVPLPARISQIVPHEPLEQRQSNRVDPTFTTSGLLQDLEAAIIEGLADFYHRLERLGWRAEPPADSSVFLGLEPGSSRPCHMSWETPWFRTVSYPGVPSRIVHPILWKPMEDEV